MFIIITRPPAGLLCSVCLLLAKGVIFIMQLRDVISNISITTAASYLSTIEVMC